VLVLVGGLFLVMAAQAIAPLAAAPLYDGVVVQDPYRYLSPATGQDGAPTSASETLTVQQGTSPAFAAATSESPPQAQLIGPAAAFALAPDTTALTVSVVPTTPQPADGVAGNAYRISVTDEHGTPLSMAAGSQVTVVLRAPLGVGDASIAQLRGEVWQMLPTQPAGLPGVFTANASSVGDFAILGTLTATPSPGGDARILWLGLAIVLTGVIALSLVGRRRGDRQPPPATTPKRPARKGPSKPPRKGPP